MTFQNSTSVEAVPRTKIEMPIEIDDQGRTYIHHPSGQRTHYILNSFVDPWKPHDTILIQHGFGRHAGFWYHWIPVLSRHYHVIRRDLRGHGYSSYPTGKEVEVYKYNLDTILREIVDTLDQLGVRKVHFLGESTGGMLGEALAAKYPDRLLSLTVCSTPTHLPSPALKMFAFDKKDWPTACRELGSRGWAEALSKLPGTIPIEDPAYLPWYLDQIAISDGEGLAQYAEFLAHLDTRPFLPWIKLPMLILAPSNSAATRLEEQQKLLSQVPNARMEVISGKGHEIYVTEAEICQYVFLSFLAELAEVRRRKSVQEEKEMEKVLSGEQERLEKRLSGEQEGWERRLREEQEGLERRLSGERDKMQKRRSGQQEKLHSAMNGEERAKGMVGAEKERKDSLGVMGQ